MNLFAISHYFYLRFDSTLIHACAKGISIFVFEKKMSISSLNLFDEHI
jgi:hypothetical protein